MHKVNVGISYEHPKQGFLYHRPGETVDLSDWPDLDKLVAEGTITPIEELPVKAKGKATPTVPLGPAQAELPQEGS